MRPDAHPRPLLLMAVCLAAALAAIPATAQDAWTVQPIARVVEKNGKQCVAANGVEGRTYDRILDLTISPDNKRFAYIGINEGHLRSGVWVVADREEWRCGDVARGTLSFSPDSRIILYVTAVDGKWCMAINGKPGKGYDSIRGKPVFSPDSTKAAFVAADKDRWFVVLDGREGKPYESILEGTPVFSPDGGRLGYAALLGGKWRVIVDGVEQAPYDDIGGQTGIAFSRDGKRMAYAARVGTKWVAVVDGKEGRPYDGIGVGTPVFGPDGAHSAYLALKARTWVVVADGEEVSGYAGETTAAAFVATALKLLSLQPVELEAAKLVYCLWSEDRAVRKSAQDRLIQLGGPAVEPLLGALRAADAGVRAIAAETLGRIGDARAVTPLVEALRDESFMVRYNANRALSLLWSPAVGERLLQRLGTEKDLNLIEAAFTLLKEGRFTIPQGTLETLTINLTGRLPSVPIDGMEAATIVQLFGQIGKTAVPRLIQELKTGKDQTVLVLTAFALGGIGADASAAVPALIEAFPVYKGSRQYEREQSVKFLTEGTMPYFILRTGVSADSDLGRNLITRLRGEMGILSLGEHFTVDEVSGTTALYGRNAKVIEVTNYTATVRFTIYAGAYALRRITGRTLGNGRETWEAWWKTNAGVAK